MARESFITPEMSGLLDFLRIASALVVVVGHARQLDFIADGPVSNLGAHYAVVVFFVVSGLSIGTSVARPGANLRKFAADRAARIVPVALAAILFGSLAFALRHGKGAVMWDTPNLTLTAGTLLYPALFLTESPHGVLPLWNPAYWSLSYEAWYYALFAATFFLRGARRVGIVALLGATAGPQILAMMPIWLMGVLLAAWPRLLRIGSTVGLLLLALAALLAALVPIVDMPLLRWIGRVSPIALVNSQNVLADSLLGLAVALGLAGVRPLLRPLTGMLESSRTWLRWSAGMTFTAYLFHVPLVCLAESWGLRGLSGTAAIAALAGILAACAVLAELVERRTPRLRRTLERLRYDPRQIFSGLPSPGP